MIYRTALRHLRITTGQFFAVLSGALFCMSIGADPGQPVTAHKTQPSDPAAIEFFEKRIRPVLVKRCLKCHGPQQQKNGFRLDSRESLLKGGDSGPAIVARMPTESLLIEAVSYRSEDLQMPPTGKLPALEIADLKRWVQLGAPWPKSFGDGPKRSTASDSPRAKEQDSHWSFQPVSDPAVPPVDDESWARTAVDRFLLARLDEKGLRPAPPTEKRMLIRRATFDLIGLPPSPKEVEAFVADNSPDAFQKVIDRLLVSPHYGERWGRHWLDLIGFAETNGHEYDREKLHAWRYRDYVIRAFNGGLPYDQFVMEHLAGDLLPDQRVDPDEQTLESPLGTGFLWMSDMLSDTLDVAQSRADQVDKQIDVMGKAFLGLTLACARCHDHKFDPVSIKDYYALAGYLHGTVLMQHVCIDSPQRRSQVELIQQQLVELDREIVLRWRRTAGRLLKPKLKLLKEYLLAAREVLYPVDPESPPEIQQVAVDFGLEAEVLKRWVQYMRSEEAHRSMVFGPWITLAKHPRDATSDGFRRRVQTLNVTLTDRGSRAESALLFEDFRRPTYKDWKVTGWAFGSGPGRGPLSPFHPLSRHSGTGLANSFRSTNAATGMLVSKLFRADKRYIHVLMAGGTDVDRSLEKPKGNDEGSPQKHKVCVRFVVNEFQRPTLLAESSRRLGWQTVRLRFLFDRLGHLEIVDRSPREHIVVDRIYFSDDPEPPEVPVSPNRLIMERLADPTVTTMQAAAESYEQLFLGLLDDIQRNQDDEQHKLFDNDRQALEDWLLRESHPFVENRDLSGLVRRLGLKSVDDTHDNVGGLREKWIRGTKKEEDEWFYITPDGKLFRSNNSFEHVDGTLVATLDRKYHNNPRLLLESPEEPSWLDRIQDLPSAGDRVERSATPDEQVLAELIRHRRDLDRSLPKSAFARVAVDDRPQDVRVHLRGSHKNLGDLVPRRFLAVLGGTEQPPLLQGSGRLQLARSIADPLNPLTARVMVNRIWQHHFGAGLVRTPDNFGLAGEKPTHPQLLDYLTTRFVESGWSIKAMHRLIMSSRAYRMSSRADPDNAQIDPENWLLHHFSGRRLEAEVIRDSLLAVSGGLRRDLYGTSVRPYITKYQQGKAKPASGPLDGDGRRSIYLEVRRNFLVPMFLAFDYPLPTGTAGRRGVSASASQALFMLNNGLVAQQAERWAQRLLAEQQDVGQRIETMFLEAFGRAPDLAERETCLAFLDEHKRRYGSSTDPVNLKVWSDLCHMLVSTVEFIFIQ